MIYKAIKSYTIQLPLKVRTGPSFNSPQKQLSDLSAASQVKCFPQKFAVLKPETQVTPLKVIKDGLDIWFKCSFGYICAQNGDKIYIK